MSIERDALGPVKIVHLYEPRVGLRAMVVVDNVAAGPAIGGTRMAPDVTVEEVARLARAMTLKNAAAGLPHGGAKSGIIHDPTCSPERKEELVRTFARMIRDITDYIPGPDMGTNERSMAFVQDEIGRSVGLPRVLGGIPLDEIGATAYGVAACADVAAAFMGMDLDGARVCIQGMGAVGMHTALFLTQRGCKIVGCSDFYGAIVNPDGLDAEAVVALKRVPKSVIRYEGAHKSIERDSLIGVDCDIWVPAARPDAITMDNVEQLKAKLVLQGANIPATLEAEEAMHRNGIVSIPDFIANAGGVICASVEYHGGTETQALAVIEDKIKHNTRETLERAKSGSLSPRAAAETMARERVEQAMEFDRP